MFDMDIGIDLGTANVLVFDALLFRDGRLDLDSAAPC